MPAATDLTRPLRLGLVASLVHRQSPDAALARLIRPLQHAIAHELRAQLSRYGDALENDLAAGRERIATRVKEALGYEQSFSSATHLLLNHLKGRPECRELIEELEASTSKSMLSKLAAQSLHTNAS